MFQEFFRVPAFPGGKKFKFTVPAAEGTYSIICTYKARPAAECDKPDAVFVGKIFVVDQPYPLLHQCFQESVIVLLLLGGMGKEHIVLTGNKPFNIHLFHPYEEAAV